jgi:DUF917 family protein
VTPVKTAIASIRTALSGYLFRVRSEAELQGEVYGVLCIAYHDGRLGDVELSTEVRKTGGRFDIQARWSDVTVVLELKLRAPVAAVERQSQRYAMMPDVDAVLVVTTSQRLTSQLATLTTLGGKPFSVFAVRTS